MQSLTFLIVVFGYLAFGLWAIIWISKKKKAGEKISLWAKIIIAAIFLSSSSVLISVIGPSPVPENGSEAKTFYVKSESANVRECPSTSCKVINSLSQNTPLTFSGDLFDKYHEWAEITFPNGEIGYVSKTTLSSESPIKSPPQGSGIALGAGDFEPLIVGNSYGFSFCVPESARSGTTCGGLAGDTQSPVGGSPPYSLVKGSGFFPPGMSLELNGWFFGSPTTPGTYNFQICAKDLRMNQGCQNYTIVVKKEKASIATPLPVTETAEFAKIESAACQALGYSVPDNPNSWIVYRITVTGTSGVSVGGGVRFYCDSRYGGGPCHKQFSSCDSWTKHPEYQSCRREANQQEITRWTYQAEGFINTEIGFNFGVQAGRADEINMNVSCK